MTTEQRIRELQIKRMNLIAEYNGDRFNPTLLKREKEIIKEIENLMKKGE